MGKIKEPSPVKVAPVPVQPRRESGTTETRQQEPHRFRDVRDLREDDRRRDHERDDDRRKDRDRRDTEDDRRDRRDHKEDKRDRRDDRDDRKERREDRSDKEPPPPPDF